MMFLPLLFKNAVDIYNVEQKNRQMTKMTDRWTARTIEPNFYLTLFSMMGGGGVLRPYLLVFAL